MFGTWEMKYEQLGMPERAVIMYYYVFFQANNQKLPVFWHF
jgi:hypothetical protein